MSEHKMNCRDARTIFRNADDSFSHPGDRQVQPAFERHLEACSSCREEYRLHRLQMGVLILAGTAETMAPDNEWFAGLRARLTRESMPKERLRQEETWQSVLWLNARQLVPIMALLLLIVLGATVLWGTTTSPNRVADRGSVRPSDRVFFNDVYEYPQPTSDDVLQTLVAVEERPNGK